MTGLQRMVHGRLERVYHRIYQDFLMPSRIPEYRRLLGDLMDSGYQPITMRELVPMARGEAEFPPRTFVHRVDVDSDRSTAREMFRVEREVGVRSTYYFRLSTLDPELMRDIQRAGGETGYHFEELATVAKERGLRTRPEVERHLGSMRERFCRNLERYQSAAGSLPRTVASHGDFANRRIGVTNSLLIDGEIRDRFGILAEAYDAWLVRPVTMRLSDDCGPRWWVPEPPDRALRERPPCLYILVHPRHWRARPLENLRMNWSRASEDVVYRFNQLSGVK